MRRLGYLVAVTAALFTTTGAAHAATVTNGDFEAGDLSGWTVNSTSSESNGYWFAYSGTVAPLTGAALSTTIAAPTRGPTRRSPIRSSPVVASSTRTWPLSRFRRGAASS